MSSLSSQLIALVFTKQPYAERYLPNIFCQYFCELLGDSRSASKYVPKSCRKFLKKTPVAKYYVSKVADFYRMRSAKKMFLERCFQNPQEKACVRESILIKLHS